MQPGIISTTEKQEDRGFVDMITEMTKSYIQKEKAIIVCTVSCKSDIDTQARYIFLQYFSVCILIFIFIFITSAKEPPGLKGLAPLEYY